MMTNYIVFRILILALLSFSAFAKEGEIKHKEIRIYVNDVKSIYIVPELIFDINKLTKKDSTLKDTKRFIINIKFEF